MDNKKEQLIAVFFSVVGALAILINLSIKGFSAENLLDAVKDLVGLLVTVAIFLVAYSISNKSKSFIDAGRMALEKLRKNFADLQGPEYDKTDYDPEETLKSQRMRYLFFKKGKYSKKVAFIPLEPLEQGILDIRISKATLVNFGIDSKNSQIDSLISGLQSDIYLDLKNYLSSKYTEKYEILNKQDTDNKASKYSNSAIVIDFDEDKLKIKGFEKAIYNCSEKALQIILKNKQKWNS